MTFSEVLGILSGTTATTGVLLYILKRTFDRALSARFSELEKKTEARIAEVGRRQAAIFDDQFGSLKALVALAYRMRNSARSWMTESRHELDDVHEVNTQNEAEAIRRVSTYSSAFRELLYENKAILPPNLFDRAHLFQRTIESFQEGVSMLAEAKKAGDSPRDPRRTIDIRFEMTEEAFQDLADAVHNHLGIKEDAEQSN